MSIVEWINHGMHFIIGYYIAMAMSDSYTHLSIQMNHKNKAEQKKSLKYTSNLISFTEKPKAGNTVLQRHTNMW